MFRPILLGDAAAGHRLAVLEAEKKLAWKPPVSESCFMNPDSSIPGTPSPDGSRAPAGIDFEPFVDGFTGTPEEIERQWFEKVYKGRGDSMRQLTWRAIVMGSVLGGVLSLTNLYIGLKAGWGFGVAITA